ncbi:hypothetical protein [Flammeovirga sp. OC4]|uniref:hypothetical protein n=1 Tax=Flammeovirga sp. OC4 TaxID=1382345 RepID=UPI0005C676C5|nr:hypothetical protein [Flammeovirga sp. OC4]
MTLIANTLNDGFPILIGDLLVSSPTRKDDFKIPTFLEGVEKYMPKDMVNFPVKLNQKIKVINSNLALGSAGLLTEIETFHNELNTYLDKVEVDTESLNKFKDELDLTKYSKSAFLLLFYDSQSESFISITISDGYWKTEPHEYFNTINAVGTGATGFIEECNRYKNENIECSGNTNITNKALSVNTILLSGLLSKESFSLETIKKNWGAGFEIIYFDSDTQSFTKLTEFSYIIWRGKYSSQKKKLELEPYLILSYKYFNGVLAISSFLNGEVDGYGVLPIGMNKDTVDHSSLPKKFEVYNQKICNTFVIELDEGKVFYPSAFISQREDGHTEIGIKINDSGQLEIMLNKELENKLKSRIEEQFYPEKEN